MKIGKILLPAVLLGVLLQNAAAQPASTPPSAVQKIATVDLRKVFDGYWKTKQADTNLKDRAADLEKERKSLMDQYQKGQETYKKLADGANDQAVSAEEREKRKKSAEAELLKLKDVETTVRQFDASAKSTLGEQQRRMRDNILGEIKDAIKAKAKKDGWSFVLDSAGESITSTPVLIYHSGDHDITDAVVNQLNLSAPAGFKAPDPKPFKDK